MQSCVPSSSQSPGSWVLVFCRSSATPRFRTGWAGWPCAGASWPAADLTSYSAHVMMARRWTSWNSVRKHPACVCAFITITPVLHRRVYFWRVCFLSFTLCVRRSWIVTTLLLKVSNVLESLFTGCSDDISSHVTCYCSFNTVAEKSERMLAGSLEDDRQTSFTRQQQPAAAARSHHLDQRRKPSESLNWISSFYRVV